MTSTDDLNDDFGDLYADDCVKIFEESNVDNVDIGENKGFGLGLKREIDGGEEGKNDADNADSGSDSEDDLNIVLNDDGNGCGPVGFSFPRNGGIDEDIVVGLEEEEQNGGGFVEEKARKWGNSGQLANGLEHGLSSSGRGNGGRGSFRVHHPRYKYTRQYLVAFLSNSKGNGLSTSCRGDYEDNVYNQHTGSNPVIAQNGYNFSLPRSRTILDVNIDIFEQKPWRHPGVDKTDFFNFGFDEDSWKRYCNSLHQYHQNTILRRRFPTLGSLRPFEAYEDRYEQKPVADDSSEENFGQITKKRTVAPVFEITCGGQKHFDMPIGKAIQVQDSTSERQSTMDVKHPVDWDPDVVIEIVVQDSKDDSSGSAKEGPGHLDGLVNDASKNGDCGVDDGGDIVCYSSASQDQLPVELPEEHGEGLEAAVSKRSPQQTKACNIVSVSSENQKVLQNFDVNGFYHHVKVGICDSEKTAEVKEISNVKSSSIGRDACNTVISMLETEPPDGVWIQSGPKLSFSGSDCGAPSVGTSVGTPNSPNYAKRSSTSSVAELQQSVSTDHSPLRSHDTKRKPENSKYYARNRSSFQGDSKHYTRRFHGVSELGNGPNDENVYPLSDADRYYDYMRHSTAGLGGQEERCRGFDLYDEEGFSCDEASEVHLNQYGERFYDYQGGAAVGDQTDRYRRRNLYKKSMMEDQMMEFSWYNLDRGPSTQDIGPPCCQESKQLNLSYSSYFDKERGCRWKRKRDELLGRRRIKNNDFVFDREYENNFMLEKQRKSVSYNERGRNNSEHYYKRHSLHTRRELYSPGRQNRRCGGPSVEMDNLWSVDDADEQWRCMDHRSISSHSYKEPYKINGRRKHDFRCPTGDAYGSHGRHVKYERETWSERCRDDDWLNNYNDAFDNGDSLNNFGNLKFGRRCYWQSDIPCFVENEYISGHHDEKFYAEGLLHSFERPSRCRKFDAKPNFGCGGRLSDEKKAGGRKPTREGNGGRSDRSSKFIHRICHEQKPPKGSDSVDSHMVGWVGKSFGRCFKAGTSLYNSRQEIKDGNMYLGMKASEEVNGYHVDYITHADNLKADSSDNDEKWLDKFPITPVNEALDFEECQIKTEQIYERPAETICVPEDAAVSSDVKKYDKNASNRITTAEACDNPRILEMIVKMEKRRERFKEPITLKKEIDKSHKLLVDAAVKTAGTKQQRPTRKRQWGGN